MSNAKEQLAAIHASIDAACDAAWGTHYAGGPQYTPGCGARDAFLPGMGCCASHVDHGDGQLWHRTASGLCWRVTS